MYMYQEKIKKWRILSFSFLAKFGQKHCTIVQGLLSDFGATLKIHKKSKFDWNELKLSTQHKNMYMYQEKYKNGGFSPFHFWQNLAKNTVL